VHEKVTIKEINPTRENRCHCFDTLANDFAQGWMEMGGKIVGIFMTSDIQLLL
jgi:hypothetical protein